jgi:hypothetical protein
MKINHRYAEGKILPVYYPSKVIHAVTLEAIKKPAGSIYSRLRPARCGTRVEVQTFTLGNRKFLKEFDEDNPNACKHCLRYLAQDAKYGHSRSD